MSAHAHADADTAPLLQTVELTRRFEGLTAVDSLDLTVQKGDIFGLIGPNGSGKTTTLHMLSGFLGASAGDILHHGESIRGLAPSKIARRGLVRTFQLTNVFGGYSALDNVIHAQHLHASDSIVGCLLLTPRYRREQRRLRDRARELLEVVHFAESRMNVPAANLSAGEQRRLEIAVGLGTQPHLVLLDEPASGLNDEETKELVTVLHSLRDEGITTVLVEHNMRMVLSTCNRIAVLNFGRKIADGTPSEISSDEHVVAAYLGERRDA